MQQQQLFTNSANLLYSKPSAPNEYQHDDMKIQIYYAGEITVIYFREPTAQQVGRIRLEQLYTKIREICKFESAQPFTLKWIDEEGDPCTLSSQLELDEAIRLYYLNKESELVVHVFPNVPERPGHQCAGEDRSIYRRGARRWRKFYLVNGHKYQAKRFARTALCKVCQDRIWGLGRQGYKCLECKIMVHKRCHKFITTQCNDALLDHQQQQMFQFSSPALVNSSSFNNTAINANISSNSKHQQQQGKITSSATLSSISSSLSPASESNLR